MKNRNNIPTVLSLQNYELVFFRRLLGNERLSPEMGKIRNSYVQKTLVPTLQVMDKEVSEFRDANAVRTASGNIKTKEDGSIDYGDKEINARRHFENLMQRKTLLVISNKEELAVCRTVWQSLKQELDENDTHVYLKLLEKLNNINLV